MHLEVTRLPSEWRIKKNNDTPSALARVKKDCGKASARGNFAKKLRLFWTILGILSSNYLQYS